MLRECYREERGEERRGEKGERVLCVVCGVWWLVCGCDVGCGELCCFVVVDRSLGGVRVLWGGERRGEERGEGRS